MSKQIADKNLKEGDLFFDINGDNEGQNGLGVGVVVKIFNDRDLFIVKFPQEELNWMFDQSFMRWDKAGKSGARRGYTEKEVVKYFNILDKYIDFDEDILDIMEKQKIRSLDFLFKEKIGTVDKANIEGMTETGSVKSYKYFIVAESENRNSRLLPLAEKIENFITTHFTLYDYNDSIVCSSPHVQKILQNLAVENKINLNGEILTISNDLIVRENYKDETKYIFQRSN